MSKAVMISIQPKWCELICSGKKTVEVRKSKPKLGTPFKCYIYMTKGKPGILKTIEGNLFEGEYIEGENLYGLYEYMNGKVIGEFVCDSIDEYESEFVPDDCMECIQRIDRSDYWDCDTATGEIIWDNETEYPLSYYNMTNFAKQSCIQYNELKKYVGIGINTFYAWHICDLVIYDKPKELIEFSDYCYTCDYAVKKNGYLVDCDRSVKRPPQSWCYVMEADNDRQS